MNRAAEQLIRYLATGYALTSLLSHPESVRAMFTSIASILPAPPTDSQLALAYLQIWHNR